MSRAVIFDIGNVLIAWDARRIWAPILGPATEAFMAEIGFAAWNRALDRGGRWAEATAALAARHPAHADLIRRADTHWQEAVPGPVPGALEIIDALALRETPLYAITNFSTEKWDETRGRFPFLATAFRDVVVSSHHGLLKPEPEIYALCLERNALRAPDCVFIDDSPANVETAARLGFDAILFEGAAALRPALAARGLLA